MNINLKLTVNKLRRETILCNVKKQAIILHITENKKLFHALTGLTEIPYDKNNFMDGERIEKLIYKHKSIKQ